MAKAKTSKRRSRSRTVRDLAPKAGTTTPRGGAPKSKRFSANMYAENVSLKITKADA